MSSNKRKGGRWCSAPNFRNNSNTNKDISFFTFPKDVERAEKWTVNSRRADLLKEDAKYLNKNCRICCVHFEEVMFANFMKNRLKHDAHYKYRGFRTLPFCVRRRRFAFHFK